MADPGTSGRVQNGPDSMQNHRFDSDGLNLAAYLARPANGAAARPPGVLVCHGFPSGPGGGANSPSTFPELASRIAGELGWLAMVPYLRGMPGSDGSFSLGGWRDDVLAAAVHLVEVERVDGLWAVGFGTGAGLAICAAALEPRIGGVGAFATPADWSDWAANPRRLLLHARDAGLVDDPAFPADFGDWASSLASVSAERSVADMPPRDLLLVHGSEDDIVPPLEARALAEAHGAADLRLIGGAGHHLRHDPRAIAVLMGWLDRQRRQRKPDCNQA